MAKAPKVKASVVPIVVAPVVKGLRFDLPLDLVPMDTLIDCKNVQVIDSELSVAPGWEPWEGRTAAVPDFQGPIALMDELALFSGTFVPIVGTPNDLYKRTGFGAVDFITPKYTAGTVSIASGTPTIVTGTGTLFLTNVSIGDRFRVDANGTWVSVQSVDTDLQLTLVSAYPGTPYTNVAYTARQLFVGDSDRRWAADVFNDKFICSHLQVEVQQWDGTAATTSKLITFKAIKAETINIFANRPMIGHTEEDGTIFRQRVRWPDNGDETAWDDTIAASEAGFLDITEGADWVVAFYRMGNHNIVYKERSIHLLTEIGLPFVFGRTQAITGVGLLGKRGVADLGDEHIFLGNDNFYIFNGISLTPIGDAVIGEVFDILDPDKVDEIQAWLLEEAKVIEFIIPLTTGGFRAYTYHYEEEGNVWTKRNIPSTATGYFTQAQSGAWNEQTQAWSTSRFAWASRQLLASFPLNVFGDANGRLFTYGTVDSEDGQAISAFAQFGLLGAVAGDKNIIDFNKEVVSLEPWAQKSGVPGHKLKVEIGAQDRIHGSLTFTTLGDYELDGSGSAVLDGRVQGKLFSPKFSTPDTPQVGNAWKLKGYEVLVSLRGKRKF